MSKKDNDTKPIITILYVDLEYRIDHTGATAQEVEAHIADIKSRIESTSPDKVSVTRTFPE